MITAMNPKKKDPKKKGCQAKGLGLQSNLRRPFTATGAGCLYSPSYRELRVEILGISYARGTLGNSLLGQVPRP